MEMMAFLELSSIEELYELYQKSETIKLKKILIESLTNNETFFFRDEKQFLFLAKVLIPEMEHHFGGPLKIWCAACSKGQEPFSVLMAIHYYCKENIFTRVRVVATDISNNVLEYARNGLFTEKELAHGIDKKWKKNYFHTEEGKGEILEDFKKKVTFKEFNLVTGKYPTQFYQVVLCRNVLIYQSKEIKLRVLNKIYQSLVPGGYLFLGTGETLKGLETPFKMVFREGVTFFQK